MIPISAASKVAQSLFSDRTFDIEFQGYLSNHAKHAIVALDKLGAPDERILEYWADYTTLTPYKIPLHKVETPWESVRPCTAQEWSEWRGNKIRWQEMVQFLDDQEKSSHQLVKEFAPDLLNGIAGGLTHGIIHLGWGIDSQDPWMIQEGLAYLNFCHVPNPPLESSGIVEPDAGTSILRIAQEWQDLNLKDTWIEPSKEKYDESFHPELVPAGFQWHLAKVLTDAHPVATKIPSWIREKPLPEVWEELYHAAALIHLAARDAEGNGNFVVLHLLTSLWGLEKVCTVVDNEAVTRTALENYWAMAICLLCASTGGFPAKDQIESAVRAFPPEAIDEESFDWTDTVKRGCAEEEEHNIKLVYVGKELWGRYGRWGGFSETAKSFILTPNISPAKTTFKA
jgi:hypothetical protein